MIKGFFEKRRLAKAQKNAEKIGTVVAPFICGMGAFALEELKKYVPSWSLKNKVLLNYLGYVAGVITNAEYNILGTAGTGGFTASEIVFDQIIEAQLDWIPGTDDILKMHRAILECGGSGAIVGMQRFPDGPRFNRAMKLGAEDICSIGSPGYLPKGLIELGLFCNVDEEDVTSNANIFVKEAAIAELLEKRHDPKLLEKQFWFADCLDEVNTHCMVNERNVVSTDIFFFNPWYMSLSTDSHAKSCPFDEYSIQIPCSEPIISRSLRRTSEIDLTNCFDVTQSIYKYLVASCGVSNIKTFFHYYKKEKMNEISPCIEDNEMFQRVKAMLPDVAPIDMRFLGN